MLQAEAGACCPNPGGQNPCGPVVHTSFVPMTCGQNLYTQYHKLLFPNGEQVSDFDFVESDDCNSCKFVADLSATYRFIQSSNGSQIASYLWGSNTLLFQGSEVADRENNALVATQFHPEKSGDAGILLLKNWLESF